MSAEVATKRFRDRTILVTGAASGIGREMARQFRDEGGAVYSADIDPSGCAEGTTPLALDVASQDQFEFAVGRILRERGRLDVLCNNAGQGSTADVMSCSVAEWDRVFTVNARGVFLGIKSALPGMLRQGSGSIVNTASVAGMVGLPNRSAYCASKGAVIALTKQVAVQYAAKGVRCNSISPGTVDSPWVDRLLSEAAKPEEARRSLVARQPMGRLGIPWEIAAAALYLASDDASFITGTNLVIDGGLVAG